MNATPETEVTPESLVPDGGWRERATPNLAPLRPEELTWPQRRLVNHIMRRHQVPARHLFHSLLHAPRLFFSWLVFGAALMPYGSLSRRQTELVILRTAWCCRCRYEWMQHVGIARNVGLSDGEIRRVTQGADAGGWTPLESIFLRAVDDQLEQGVIGDVVWAELSDSLSDRKLVELMMLIGHYRMLAGVIDSLGVQVETP